MRVEIIPNKVQKYVLLKGKEETFLWGNPEAEYHKDIVREVGDSGIGIVEIKGGGKIKISSDESRVYVWGNSSRYGKVDFEIVKEILEKKFPGYQILNEEI